jgi:hypothetical protein
MKKIIRQDGDKMHIFIIYLRKSAFFKFKGLIFQFSKKDYLDDIRNLGVPKSSTPQNVTLTLRESEWKNYPGSKQKSYKTTKM